MAIFNPEVPVGRDDMPSWLRQTSPISSLEVDKSAGLGLATIGTGIEGATEIATNTSKDIINKDVRSTVEPIREDYTNQLLAGRAIIQGAGNVTAPSSSGQDGQPLSLLTTNDANMSVPASLDQGLNKVGSIQAFMQNGNGKTSVDQTYYDMRLKDAVTGLRSRYPGFVDYIDSKVSAITGMNPANETVNDLQRQLAQLQTNKKSEFDKEVDLSRGAMSKGLQNADKMHEALLQRGEAFLPQWRQWYTEENAKFTRLQYQQALRQSADANKADFKDTREKDWTNEAGTAVSNNMNTMLTLSGMKEGKPILALMQDAINNPNKYGDEQMKEFATKVLGQKTVVSAQLDARASQTFQDDKGGTYSYNSDVTAPKVQEIKRAVLGYYDQIASALTDGNAGLAFARAKHAQGMLDTTKDKIYSHPDIGDDIRTAMVLKDLGPAWEVASNKRLLEQNVDQTMDTLFTARSNKARAQPDPDKPYTFKDMSGEALDLEQGKRISAGMRSRYLKGGLSILDDITDKQAPDQAKVNALRFFFSKEGQGTLSNWKDDYVDPIRNINMPGRQTVWGKMTSESAVNEVKRLSSLDPAIGTMYRSWIKNEAATQLYYKDFVNLNSKTGVEDLHFKYYDGDKGGVPYIEVIGKDGNPINQTKPTNQQLRQGFNQPEEFHAYMDDVQRSVGRINSALAGVHRVEKTMGGNASADLLGFLINAQVDLGKNWTGLPARIMDAIAASQGKASLKKLMEEK